MSQFIEMFGGESNKVPFEEIVVVKDDCRRPINEGVRSEMKDGELYPYYGATGVVDYINDYLTDDELLCIAEDCGNYNAGEESAYIIRGKAWVNNHAHLVKTKEACDVKYLYYFLKIADLKPYVSGTTRLKLTQKKLKKISVTLPSTDKQKTFVKIAEQADKSKFGDFKSQFIEMFGNPLSSRQKNELKRLGQCCIINPRRPNIALCDTDKVSFIPMLAVSEDGYLVDMADEEYGKVKKGFTYFENNDVLFAKITPCMENGKGAIAYGLTNGIGVGSTEFHVLRPINGISSPYWLLTLTRMPIFRERAAKNMSGTGGQKRVSASYLNHFMVGLPAIEEQRRFEAIYRQADKSKSVIQKALVYLNDIQSDELGKIA